MEETHSTTDFDRSSSISHKNPKRTSLESLGNSDLVTQVPEYVRVRVYAVFVSR